MITNKFIVLSTRISTGEISLSRNPYHHNTEEEAVTEAKRLANLHRDKEFTVVKVVGTAKLPVGVQFN